jgi:predicted Zn-dependent peptidase
MPDRTVQPAFQNSSSFDLIHPETITLKNKLPITIVRGGEQAVAKIEFVFGAGKWYEEHPGVSYFTAHQLQKGTASKTSYQISSEMEQLGVHVDVSPGHDFSSVSLYGLTKNIQEVFDLTREILTAPAFPEHELDQMKAIYNQTLKINLEKTSYLASLELRRKLFGSDHPYGQDAGLEDVTKIQRNWLSDFHTARFGNFRIICSGKIQDSVLHTLTDCFQSIQLNASPEKEFIATQAAVSVGFIEKKESVQSSIKLGRRAVNRTHADYPALLLLNHIFGGYFGSRLMKNIREEKGLTYGINSSVAALKHASYLTIGTDVNKENRELALQEIKNEMHKLCNQLIEKSELETARNHFIGSLQSEITTPFAHADKIKNLLLFSLPEDYYQQLILKVGSLSSQDLMETANKYLHPETFISVTVG